jgi:putative ABC transport system substrate-binding protein
MRRRSFIVSVAGAVIAWPFLARGQKPTKVARIGVLSPFSSSTPVSPAYETLGRTLRELGWIEGQNLVFEHRFAEGQANRLPALARELAELEPDLIFDAWGTPAAIAAKQATAKIPIVFVAVGDAVGVGLVASIARPGGNITGSTFLSEETIAKQLDLLKEAVPTLSKVGVLINPANPVYGPVIKATESPARSMNLQLRVFGVQNTADCESAFADAMRERVDGLIVLRDPVFILNSSRLVELAESHRIPTLYGLSDFVEAGGLMSYGPDLRDMFRRAAHIMDKILTGANPREVPVEQSTRFEAAVNLKTAKAIGMEIPTSILLRADKVIE